MNNITLVDAGHNSFATHPSFELVGCENVLFKGKTVQKLTYQETHCLLWKISQVAIAALLTLVTCGILLCFQKGRSLWLDALQRFKNVLVYQNCVNPINAEDQKPKTTPILPQAVVVFPPASLPKPIVPPMTISPVQPVQAPPAPLSPSSVAHKMFMDFQLEGSPEYCPAVKAWAQKSIPLKEQVEMLGELTRYGIGTKKWDQYFGKIVGATPPLPDAIYEICNSDDHSQPGEKIKDTHVLVLVPEAVMVDGKPIDITLERLGKLVKAPKGGGYSTQYRLIAPRFANMPVAKSHWALMKKKIIDESNNKTFKRQKEMVTEYSQQAKIQYSVPSVRDAVVCSFMHYVHSGKQLFEISLDGATSTLDLDKDMLVSVGFYNPYGLSVIKCTKSAVDHRGITVIRNF